MYKALFVFLSFFLVPFFANGECVLNSNNNGCQSYDGCQYIEAVLGGEGPSCGRCDEHQYNINTDYPAVQSTSCITCSDSFFDSGTHKQFDETITSYNYRNSCPWKCADKWYESNDYNKQTGTGQCMNCPKLREDDNNHAEVISLTEAQTWIEHCVCNTALGRLMYHEGDNNSSHKYFCGVCGAGTYTTMAQGNTGINICSCHANANRVGGTAQNDQGQLVECKCPANSHVEGGNCKCNDNMVMVQDSETDPWRCESCPDNSEVSGNTCICKQNYYNNANTDVGEMPNCLRCPSGTFKGPGNAGINACQMDHNTKFCDRNGQNCMQLIPES